MSTASHAPPSGDALRRLRAGVDEGGLHRILGDDEVKWRDSSPGNRVAQLWSVDSMPPPLGVDLELSRATAFPGPGALRVALVEFGPRDGARGASMDEELSKVLSRSDGFHRTHTVDVGYVVSGEVVLRMADGDHRRLQAGDAFVQGGGEHAWVNEGDQPCVVAMVLIGAASPDAPNDQPLDAGG